jgi:uncharacterized protein
MTRAIKPEFYKTFMKKGFFPEANKIIKYQESTNYWIFKTGQHLYKVKKKDSTQSTIALDQIFCKEIVTVVNQHSPGLETEHIGVKSQDDTYSFTSDLNSVSYNAISMKQLPDRCFLKAMSNKNNVTKEVIDQIVEFLHNFHEKVIVTEDKNACNIDTLKTRLGDLYYQSKKHLGVTITRAMIDMTLHPLEKFLNDNKKLFNRRIKKGFIRKVHGCFVPRKINVQKDEVLALGRTTDPLKIRFNDVTADLADLVVELNQCNHTDMAEYFVKQYTRLSGDKDIKFVLPVYQAIKCMYMGTKHSVAMKFEEKNKDEHLKIAKHYYDQIIDIVHKL